MKKWLPYFFLACIGLQFSPAVCQDSKASLTPKPGFICKAVIVNGDTIPEIYLKETIISEKLNFKSPEEAERYRKLVRDVKKVYPYAILLSAKVKDYDLKMAGLSKKEKRAFMKRVEPEIREQFEKAFKSNTLRQAQVLIKLIDRETGKSSHELIKHFKGGWNAFMWQSVALIIGTDLKAEYMPESDDQTIEKIVKAIEAGLI